MTRTQILMVLALAGLSAPGMAQTAGISPDCRGLVGGAMAQCVQSMGPGHGLVAAEPSRQGGRESPRSESKATAGVAQPGRAVGGGSIGDSLSDSIGDSVGSIGRSIGSALSGLFSGWGAASAGPPGPARRGASCDGLLGGEMAQCLQGMGPGSGVPSGTDIASSTDDAPTISIPRNFSVGGGQLPCQDLVGGAMAQCLQGVEAAPARPGGAASR